MEGRLLSHYRVLEKLGGGAMGVVYRGLDLRLDRHVALKFLPPELSRDTDARDRLTQEAKAASALDHPNLCTIHEIDATPEGQLFIAMAYYEGETLKKRLASGPLPVEDALDIAIQIAEGLVEAHAAGIVHRDIKPANVMLTKHTLVKIVDFGIAKLLGATGPTQAGTAMGTVAYMSPEQVACDTVDPQSDVWSLGAVLYELLTGQPPFNGDNEWAVMDAIRTQEPQPPSRRRPGIPSSIDELVARALTKSKKDRFESAAAFVEAAKTCRTELTPSVTATRAQHDATAGPFRRKSVAWGAVAAALVLGAVGAWVAFRNDEARWAREEALPEIKRLLDIDPYSPAFVLAARAEQHIPDDRVAGSAVAADFQERGLHDDAGGRHRGRTRPILLPLRRRGSRSAARRSPTSGCRTVRFTYASRHLASKPSRRSSSPPPLRLHRKCDSHWTRRERSRIEWFAFRQASCGSVSPRMTITRRNGRPPYLIDKYEVTNREFKEFVDAGGTRDRQYWEHPFESGGKILAWQTAIDRFRDQTGRPGPATWEGGTYPAAAE